MTIKEKAELAKCFVSEPRNNNRGADLHLCVFQGAGVLSYKYSEQQGSVPGLGFYVQDGRRAWFERELRKMKLPKGFYLNNSQYNKSDSIGWIAFGKEGIKTQAQAYTDIVRPGAGMRVWRQCFSVLCDELGKLTKKSPKFFGSLQK